MFKTISATKTVTISSKGQITIPKSFLTQMELSSGQELVLKLNLGKIEIINQKKNLQTKIKKLAGSINPKVKSNLSIEEQIAEAKSLHFNKN